jgi:acetyl-CoA carboxylase carboxyltransferase component
MSDSRELLRQIEEMRNTVMDEGRPEAVAKRRSFEMLTARERVAALVDDSKLSEFGSLVEPHRDNELNRDLVAPADGIITGTCKIDGRSVNIISRDYTVHGGSSGKVGGLKLARAVTRSIERGMPLVMLLEGGGHRI